VQCNYPAAVGLELDREQRGRSTTCAHQPEAETKSSEGKGSVATRGATCDAMFLPRSGSSTTERSASRTGGATCAHRPAAETKSNEDQENEDQELCDSGDRSIHLVAPPRDIVLDDAGDKREQPGWGATCALTFGRNQVEQGPEE